MSNHLTNDKAKGHLRAAAMMVRDFGNPNITVVRLDEALAILNSLEPSAGPAREPITRFALTGAGDPELVIDAEEHGKKFNPSWWLHRYGSPTRMLDSFESEMVNAALSASSRLATEHSEGRK